MSMPHDMQAVNRAVVAECRANNGEVSGERLRHARLVLLTTVGRNSGRVPTVPLGDFGVDENHVVVWASAIASPKHPDWYLNLTKNPAVVIERTGVDGRLERLERTAVTATGAERDRLFAMLAETPQDREPMPTRPHVRGDRRQPTR